MPILQIEKINLKFFSIKFFKILKYNDFYFSTYGLQILKIENFKNYQKKILNILKTKIKEF